MWVAAYYREGVEALHLAVSPDGLDWTAANAGEPVWFSPAGRKRIREPFLAPTPDGDFVLLWVDGGHSRTLGFARSADLRSFRDIRTEPLGEAAEEILSLDAPGAAWDEAFGLWRVYWTAEVRTGVPGRPARQVWAATTRDFARFSPPVRLFDPGYDVVQAKVLAEPADEMPPGRPRCRMVFRDDRGAGDPSTFFKAVRMAVADEPAGPYLGVSEPLTPPFASRPLLLRMRIRYRLLYHLYDQGRYRRLESDDAETWTEPPGDVNLPPGALVAAVLPVDDTRL